MSAKTLAVSAVLISMHAFAASARTLTLKPGAEGKDAVISSRKDEAAKNFGDSPRFPAETWDFGAQGTGTLRGLIAFDLKDIPASAKVMSAKLHLFCDTSNYVHGHTKGPTPNDSYLIRILAPWEESTVTWNKMPHRTTEGLVLLDRSSTARKDYVLDVKAMVQHMVARPDSNFGFMLVSNLEALNTALSFASGDHADTALHPALTVEYDDGTVGLAGAARPSSPGIRLAGGRLSFETPASGVVADWRGRIVVRFPATASVSVEGLQTGAYLVQAGGRSLRFVAP